MIFFISSSLDSSKIFTSEVFGFLKLFPFVFQSGKVNPLHTPALEYWCKENNTTENEFQVFLPNKLFFCVPVFGDVVKDLFVFCGK